MRQMTMVAFLQAQNCSNFVGSWRHPDAAPDFTSAEYYRRIGRIPARQVRDPRLTELLVDPAAVAKCDDAARARFVRAEAGLREEPCRGLLGRRLGRRHVGGFA